MSREIVLSITGEVCLEAEAQVFHALWVQNPFVRHENEVESLQFAVAALGELNLTVQAFRADDTPYYIS